MKTRMLCLVSGLLLSSSVAAKSSWSAGLLTGVPFYLTPEVSYQATNSDTRYYGSIKLGFDSGAAIGFERPFSANKKHAFGAFVGTLGIRDGDDDCTHDGDIIDALACSIANVFDYERVDGIGLSYSYNFNQLNESGWYTRFEIGHGKGEESERNLTSGSFFIGYQF